VELYSPIREEFFRWCDQTVLAAMETPGMVLKQWRPRKRASGDGYELVFQIAVPGEEPRTHVIPIPDKYTELLDREYPGPEEHDH
jgi:hypothetical protein